jgi:hypothetical protein
MAVLLLPPVYAKTEILQEFFKKVKKLIDNGRLQ